MGACLSSSCCCCSTPVRHTVQLPDNLETGDLILFRTNTTSAAVTRWCTDAPFDHVAMVLRTSEGYRTVECTGQGIGCWVLQERIDDHIIKGVVIRRLQTTLTNEMVDQLNQFLQAVKHKPYRLNTNLVARMMRTCLCCRRQGQNERREVEPKRERPTVHAKSPAGKYAVDDEEAKEEKEAPAAEEEDEEDELKGKDGQVPLPPLLPPLIHRDTPSHRGGGGGFAGGWDEAHQLASPSALGNGTPPRLAPTPAAHEATAATSSSSSSSSSATTTARSLSLDDGRRSSSSAAATVAASASAATAATSTSASCSSAAGVAELDPKFRVDLKDHESIRSHYPRAEDISRLHERSGFFCSSFIAACYMKMGLLPAYPPIDWYLPNTFAVGTAIQPPLIQAELGEEHLVAKPSLDRNPSKWTRPYEIRQMEKRNQQQQQRQQQQQEFDQIRVQETQQQESSHHPASQSHPPPSSGGGVVSVRQRRPSVSLSRPRQPPSAIQPLVDDGLASSSSPAASPDASPTPMNDGEEGGPSHILSHRLSFGQPRTADSASSGGGDGGVGSGSGALAAPSHRSVPLPNIPASPPSVLSGLGDGTSSLAAREAERKRRASRCEEGEEEDEARHGQAAASPLLILASPSGVGRVPVVRVDLLPSTSTGESVPRRSPSRQSTSSSRASPSITAISSGAGIGVGHIQAWSLSPSISPMESPQPTAATAADGLASPMVSNYLTIPHPTAH